MSEVFEMDKMCEIAIGLIICAGNSKTNSMLAIQAAGNFKFEEAEKYIEEAEKEQREAHEVQTQLLQEEAKGNHQQPSLIMVHAQDHLTMGLMTLDRAKETVKLYKIIDELKNK